MSKLPSPENLAALVSNVTGTMFGTTFVPGEGELRGDSLCRQMVMMRLPADREIILALSSDDMGSRSLTAAFLRCAPETVTQEMIDDVIAELLNMIAGQISAALDLKQLIGLPARTTLGDLVQAGGLDARVPVLLRSHGAVDLGLWIFEAHSKQIEAPTAATGRGRIRAAFRKIARKIGGPRVAARSR